MTEVNFLDISILLIGIYAIINNLEWLTLVYNELYKPFFTEEAVLLRIQDRIGLLPKSPILLRCLTSDLLPKFLCLTVILSGLLLIHSLFFFNSITLHLILIIFSSHLIFNTLYGFGLEGSDQMAAIVLFGILVCLIFPEVDTVIKVFLTAQVVLSYSVAGIAKIVSKEWRSGLALTKIISTKSFGLGTSGPLSKNMNLTKLLSWGIMIYEISWLFIPFNKNFCLVLICLGVIFHLANSYIMGLNLFKWSFISTYPFILSLFGYLQ